MHISCEYLRVVNSLVQILEGTTKIISSLFTNLCHVSVFGDGRMDCLHHPWIGLYCVDLFHWDQWDDMCNEMLMNTRNDGKIWPGQGISLFLQITSESLAILPLAELLELQMFREALLDKIRFFSSFKSHFPTLTIWIALHSRLI